MVKGDLITVREVSMLENAEDNLLPTVVRSELNFIQFPFFALSWRGLKQKTYTEYRVESVREGRKVELVWQVSASAIHGYPTPFDRKVVRAFDGLITEIAAETGSSLENPLQFSIYHLARLMGITSNSGRVYSNIKESIERIVATTVTSKGTFYLKDEEVWIHDVFHLYERACFKGMRLRDGGIAETNYLWLGEEYLRNINSRHVTPLDYRYLMSLNSELASRLYEVLGRKFFGLPPRKAFLRISYQNLCQVLPITAQRYFSKAKEKLDPAHEELIETGFLAKVEYEYSRGRKDFNIIYYLGKRAKAEKGGSLTKYLPPDEQLQLTFDIDNNAGTGSLELVEELVRRGLSKSASIQLSQKYPEAYIREKVEWFDALATLGSPMISNPAGWLRRSIEEDWKPSEEQEVKQEIQQREQTDKARKERWLAQREQLIEQGAKDWDKTSPEDRFEAYLKGTFWQGDPGPEEKKAKLDELISLYSSERMRRVFLNREIQQDPPEDFE